MVTILIFSICFNILLAAGLVWKWHEASRDSLTQLKNHKTFLRHYHKYARYATKRKIPFAVLFIDIDHFKRINDDYSHLTGNQAIKTVGQRLRNEIKTTDLIARYGGEEFIICLKNCTLQEAKTAANRFLHIVSNNPLKLEDSTVQLTVSIGVAGYPETAPDKLLQIADQNMYRAKQQGRNRVFTGTEKS